MQTKIIIVYALPASFAMLAAINLREPYWLLFVNLAIYAILKIYLHKAVRYWLTLIFVIAVLGSLHAGLLTFWVLLFACTLLLVSIRGKKEISSDKFGLMGAVTVVVMWYGFPSFSDIFYNLGGGLYGAIEVFQQGALAIDDRKNYKSEFAISGLGDLLIFSPLLLFKYFFEPFHWNIPTDSIVVSALEII